MLKLSARVLAVALAAGMAASALGQTPATTAFTYQGRITTGGAALSSNYDFQFKLFDAATGGTQLGSTITQTSVAASGGLFTVSLDFGQQFNSQARWLQISCRAAGVGGYQVLTPRQSITAAPHAEGLVLPIAAITNTAANGLDINNAGGNGVSGESGTGAGSAGVYGTSTASNGNGIIGIANNGTLAYGMWGQSSSGTGVVGSGLFYGGDFSASDPTGIGAYGAHFASTGTNPGVEGDSYSGDANVTGLVGHVIGGTPGIFSSGVRGISDGTAGFGIGVWGSHPAAGFGVYGTAGANGYAFFSLASGTGSIGYGGSGTAFGANVSGGTGVLGTSNAAGGFGVHGVSGPSATGVRGESSSGGGGSYGVYGTSTSGAGNGVRGDVTAGPGAYAIWGVDSTGASGSFAGYFSGNVYVGGTLSKSGGSFKIDHPLDPANKYLSHSFVESPDMMNIYNGNAQLDANGMVTITMPDWFEVLNSDFRYQLTALGAPGPNLYIAQPMKNRQFVIAGGSPGGSVSWQVTGVRQDAWANAHRIPVEELKRPEERGLFLHPDLYGMPASAGIESLKGAPPASAPQRPVTNPQALMTPPPAPAAPVQPTKEQ